MEVIYGLIPLMIFLGLVMVVILVWAVKSGQYEDLEGDANRILLDDDDPLLPGNATGSIVAHGEVEPIGRKHREKHVGKNWPDADE